MLKNYLSLHFLPRGGGPCLPVSRAGVSGDPLAADLEYRDTGVLKVPGLGAFQPPASPRSVLALLVCHRVGQDSHSASAVISAGASLRQAIFSSRGCC